MTCPTSSYAFLLAFQAGEYIRRSACQHSHTSFLSIDEMVSPLSSRILNIQCKANLRDGLQVVSDPSTAYPDRRRMKRSAGCPVENESDLDEGSYRSATNEQPIIEEIIQSKTQKMNPLELDFIASCITNDTSHGKICDQIIFDTSLKSSVPEHIDMSQVSLFLVSKNNPYGDKSSFRGSALKTSAWIDLQRMTKEFYTDDNLSVGEILSTGHLSSVTASSTCSRSCSRSPSVSEDNRSDDMSLTGVHCRNHDYSESMDVASDPYEDARTNSLPTLFSNKLNEIELDDAITHNHNSARLLIEGKHPFKAVYINAAFSNLTGLSSDSVLGKNFEKFLPSDTISDILARSGTVNHHVVTIDPSGGTVQDCSHGNIYFECSITMTLVCPPSYLLVELSKSFESSPTVDIFSEIELVSLVGDDVTEIIEPFSLVG